jgi:hypothetical protein
MIAPAADMPPAQFAWLTGEELIPQLGRYVNTAAREKDSEFLRDSDGY